MFDSVDLKVSFDEIDQKILKFWREHAIARQSFEKPATRGHYTFYEGPPTANGQPGLHHVLTRVFKDLILRYKTMRGYRVGRRSGWDTHGLPVEVEIEKQIGSTGKQDIEKYGIAEFNQLCKDSVFRYIQDWNDLTERVGFWLDLQDAYVTYNNTYIETCWWILKTLWDRGLLYEDYKVTMHCPRCNCTLSDHEVAQGMHEDVDDPSVWVKFPADRASLVKSGLLEPGENRPIYFLAWTTTPWTLAANAALAVRFDAVYALVEANAYHDNGDAERQLYILAWDRAEETFGTGRYRLLNSFNGTDLVGGRYDAIFQGKTAPGEELDRGYAILADESVSTTEGTGIVHIAPAYGDLEIGRKNRLPTVFSVDLSGRVYPEVELICRPDSRGRYAGLFFKDADKRIVRDLQECRLLYRAERIRHAYPHCWRDDSPLIFYAKNSWYIRTTAVKDKLLRNNQKINWIPEHIKTGRFGQWLTNNVDWAISRERYWGTPLPVWMCEDGAEKICVGSVKELEELVGADLKQQDLHRPYIDQVIFEKDGKTYRRVSDTVDVWFDSGAMPYAQWHYPFENCQEFAENFPADFICEAADQTRGWFYSLHALATLLTDSSSDTAQRVPGPLSELVADTSAYRNCMVLGLINDEKGQKMSKSRGNTIDPWTILKSNGADALRWYFYSSGAPDQNKNFKAADVTKVFRVFFLTLWNTYAFFVMYARLDTPDLKKVSLVASRPIADRWVLSKLHTVIKSVTDKLESFQVAAAARTISDFVINDVSNWYVRRNRRRFWKGEDDKDKHSAYLTLYEVLVALIKLAAPFAPFCTEFMYQNLVRKVTPEAPDSVHLADWPRFDASLVDDRLLSDMDVVLKIVTLGRSARDKTRLKTRQPLSELVLYLSDEDKVSVVGRFENLLREELNVKSLCFVDDKSQFLSCVVRLNLPVIGPKLGGQVPSVRRAIEQLSPSKIADNCRHRKNTRIELNDEVIELPAEAFLIDMRSSAGYVAVEEGGYMVALNIHLSPELVLEGRARDLVRTIQNARKSAGFEVSDRIHLGVEAPQDIRQAIKAFQAYIMEEALVKDLEFERLSGTCHKEEVRIGGSPVTLTLRHL